MKTQLIIAIIMSLMLISCAPEQITKTEPTTTLKENMSFDDVLGYLAEIDYKYNTSWRLEQIPTAMIKPEILAEITNKTLELQNKVQKDTPQATLVEIRLDMISAQTAHYLATKENGKIETGMINGTWQTTEKINCDELEKIAKTAKLEWLAYQSYNNFMLNMDTLLQKYPDARTKIGINENKIAFYTAPFGNIKERTQAIVNEINKTCGKKISV